jgi:hypothetical protein
MLDIEEMAEILRKEFGKSNPLFVLWNEAKDLLHS